MYAMAYFESDIPTLIEEARKTLPDDCVVVEVIEEVLALRRKYPKLSQWRDAAKEADQICYRHHFEHDSRMGETNINCSFILIGLLWGEGDFSETLRIISLAGHGGDSTTPVGVGIVAVIDGMECIPEEALANTMAKTVDAKLSINGAEWGTVPFYKTGPENDGTGLDCVYIPIVLTDDSSTLSFKMGDRDQVYILSAEIVRVTERFN